MTFDLSISQIFPSLQEDIHKKIYKYITFGAYYET